MQPPPSIPPAQPPAYAAPVASVDTGLGAGAILLIMFAEQLRKTNFSF